MNRIGTRFCMVVGGFALLFSAIILYRTWAASKRHVEEMTATQANIALAFDLAIRQYVKESIRPEMEKRIGPEEFVLGAMSTSYAARKIVDKVREQFPNYRLRFPSENPRNPINAAAPEEVEILNHFRANPGLDRWNGRLTIDGVDYFAAADVMRVDESCLRCHGDPADAPDALVQRYGETGGFHYKVGDLVGMDLVAIPMDQVHATVASQARANVVTAGAWLVVLFSAVLGAFTLVVGRRLSHITRYFQAAADDEGEPLSPMPETGRDEITLIARSYNRLAARLRHLQASLEDQVEHRTEQLSVANEHLRRERRLLKQSLRMHDRERQVIAYEIHDGLAQQLVGADMAFQLAGQSLGGSSEQENANYGTGMELLRRCLTETRRLINGVRPPLLDEEGIVAAVKNLLTEELDGGPELEFRHSAKIERLEPVLENAVYRIVQESVTNARQHSGGDRVCVTLSGDEEHLHLEVQDWGVGFDTKKKKGKAMGLRGIKKRAKLLGGKAKIESEPGRGTRVVVDLPLVPPEDDSEDSDF